MEKINFEDIRVGDVIEAHRTHSGGDTSTMRGTVKIVDEPYVLTENFTFFNVPMTEYFLVERPKHTFKVGDTITGDQAAARVSEEQVRQIADALWDDMIGASQSTVRNVLRDLFVAAGIEVAS